MNNQELTTEERQALIGFCKTTMRLKDSEGMGYKLAEFALAALTAGPVAWEVKGILCHTKEEADKYVGTPVPLIESSIDKTAQQYEAVAGWKLVPVEPTAEMHDAGDKQLATKQVWDAMLGAAPKPEGEHG